MNTVAPLEILSYYNELGSGQPGRGQTIDRQGYIAR